MFLTLASGIDFFDLFLTFVKIENRLFPMKVFVSILSSKRLTHCACLRAKQQKDA